MADESKLKAQVTETELLPCPFCGNAPALKSCCERHADIECGSCHYRLRGSLQSTDHTEIKRRWNTRHEQVKAETADLRDRLGDAEKALKALLEIPYTEYLHQPTAITMTGYAIQYRDKYGFGNEKNNSPKLKEKN